MRKIALCVIAALAIVVAGCGRPAPSTEYTGGDRVKFFEIVTTHDTEVAGLRQMLAGCGGTFNDYNTSVVAFFAEADTARARSAWQASGHTHNYVMLWGPEANDNMRQGDGMPGMYPLYIVRAPMGKAAIDGSFISNYCCPIKPFEGT